jgi:hypothetical protein
MQRFKLFGEQSLYSRSKQYLWYLIFGFLTQLFSILLPPNSNISGTNVAFCNYYINKWNIFNVHIDCDSQYFLLDSQSPLRLLSNETPLQDRPLHILFVFMLSRFLELFGVPSGSITYLGEDNIPQTYNVLDYGVYVGLNAVILGFSMLMVIRILLKNTKINSLIVKSSVFFGLVMIVQNPVNREFFWTPHSQVFNILIPAVLFQLVQKNFILSKKRFWYYLLFFASMTLVYPTFSIVLPIFFVLSWRKLGKTQGLLTLLILAPRILWPRIIEMAGGVYVDWPVVGHRRFIWMIDSYNQETLINDALDNLLKFLSSLPTLWLLITIILFLLSILIFMQPRTDSHMNFNSDMTLAAVGVSTYTMGLFLNGEYGQRFTTGLVLLITFLIMNEVKETPHHKKLILLGLSVAISLNCLYWITW